MSCFTIISLLIFIIFIQHIVFLKSRREKIQIESQLKSLTKALRNMQKEIDFNQAILEPSFKTSKPLIDTFHDMLIAIQQREESWKQLSYTDPLTQIANRRAFEHCYHEQWNWAMSNQSFLSVALIDIDQFKQFNDTFGHLAGDQCLTKIARVIKQNLSNEKTFFARLGGEEFIAIFTRKSNDEAFQIVDQVRKNVEELKLRMDNRNKNKFVTISIGLAGAIPSTHIHKSALLKIADQALYEAKNNGRNRVVCKGLLTTFERNREDEGNNRGR